MTKQEFNLLVKKHFGEDETGVILLEKEVGTQACIIDNIIGVEVVFSFANKNGNVFDVICGNGFTGTIFCKRWIKFKEDLEASI